MTVKDPEISFTYTLPEGWRIQDDPYYYYVFSDEDKDGAYSQLSLTYFGRYCPSLKECFDGEFHGALASKRQGFSEMASGEDRIDGEKALWGAYNYNHEKTGAKMQGLLYTFISNDQFFVLTAVGEDDVFTRDKTKIRETFRSFDIALNP